MNIGKKAVRSFAEPVDLPVERPAPAARATPKRRPRRDTGPCLKVSSSGRYVQASGQYAVMWHWDNGTPWAITVAAAGTFPFSAAEADYVRGRGAPKQDNMCLILPERVREKVDARLGWLSPPRSIRRTSADDIGPFTINGTSCVLLFSQERQTIATAIVGNSVLAIPPTLLPALDALDWFPRERRMAAVLSSSVGEWLRDVSNPHNYYVDETLALPCDLSAAVDFGLAMRCSFGEERSAPLACHTFWNGTKLRGVYLYEKGVFVLPTERRSLLRATTSGLGLLKDMDRGSVDALRSIFEGDYFIVTSLPKVL